MKKKSNWFSSEEDLRILIITEITIALWWLLIIEVWPEIFVKIMKDTSVLLRIDQ